MFATRLKYDKYDLEMQKSHDIRRQEYMLMPLRVTHPDSCLTMNSQTPGGPVWPLSKGTGVSVGNGNIIDVESELKGLTFDNTKCPQKKYQPNGANNVSRSLRHNTVQVNVDFTKEHKRTCSFHQMAPLILPKPFKF